ncbi:MAG TPA: HAMP domain-containing sensor histidine kinase [Longimicrobiales bacterium]|nr:HAMP domain-containing sensor histidine kinase [Longimicrobiales bacterium]
MRRFGENLWVWVVALAFVTLTLVALVLTPILVQQRVDAHRAQIEASEPARTLLMELRFNIVSERAALRDFVRTGDTTFAAMYSRARAAEHNIFSQLAPLARQLGPQVSERFVEMRTLAEQWHTRMGDHRLLRSGHSPLGDLNESATELLEPVLRSTIRLDSVIIQTTARTRSEIAKAEQTGLDLTMLLGGLAFLVALAVGVLVWRIRHLAAESERRRFETVAALAESARAAEARNRLLRGVTHDVKNPLGAARGYAELLDLGIKGPITEEQRAMVKGVQRSLDSALAIISDLLDLARSDSGGMPVHRVSTDLNEVARDAVEDHRAAAETAGHKLLLQKTDRPLLIFTDPARVRQVLDNLLSNAIKYTRPPGEIWVRTDADVRDAPRVKRAVAIRVSDNGPGIPPDKREHIFDEFTRLEDDGSLKGHGLGLAIARRIARLLGGDLAVADGNAGGATFVLWLPQREQQPD